jgi:hypothetical protein
MFLAIAVEQNKHPKNQNDYKVWYLELGADTEIHGIGVKNKDEVVESLFANYQKTGKSNWKAFTKGSETTTPIEVFDFISRNMHENTHFGNLPTMAEFQKTLDYLDMNFEIKPLAS